MSDGTYVYILNGADGKRTRDTFYRYDPTSNSYTSLAQAPQDTVNHAAVYLNGRIYRIGGCSTVFVGCPGVVGVDVYDIATNTWAPPGTVADYPIEVWLPAATTDGRYIYGVGGIPPEGGGTLKTYRYDPGANRWDDIAITDVPYVTGGAPNGVVGRRWLFTGIEDTTSDLVTIGLDLGDTGGQWVTVADTSEVLGHAVGAGSGSAFYVIGGTGPYGETTATDEFSELPCAGDPTPTTASVPTPIPVETLLPAAPLPDLSNCGPESNYVVTAFGGTGIVAGTALAGEPCDFCYLEIALPFTYTLYGQSFDRVSAGTDGALAFSHPVISNGNDCLPSQSFGFTIFPFWSYPTMTMDPRINMNLGIYVSTSGDAPNRVFNIEWRACLVARGDSRQCGGYANFEVRLYEGQARFDVVYGSLPPGDYNVTVGVQDEWSDRYTQYFCSTDQNPSVRELQSGTQLAFTQPECPGLLTLTPAADTPPGVTPTMSGGEEASPAGDQEGPGAGSWYSVGLIGLGLLLIAGLVAIVLIRRARGSGADGGEGEDQ